MMKMKRRTDATISAQVDDEFKEAVERAALRARISQARFIKEAVAEKMARQEQAFAA